MTSDDALALWTALAFEVVRRLAHTEKVFTTDELWEAIDHLPKPGDPRALGPVMIRACKERLITKSDFTVRSDRKECHARPIAVWLSLPLYGRFSDAAEYVARRRETLAAPQFGNAESPQITLL